MEIKEGVSVKVRNDVEGVEKDKEIIIMWSKEGRNGDLYFELIGQQHNRVTSQCSLFQKTFPIDKITGAVTCVRDSQSGNSRARDGT